MFNVRSCMLKAMFEKFDVWCSWCSTCWMFWNFDVRPNTNYFSLQIYLDVCVAFPQYIAPEILMFSKLLPMLLNDSLCKVSCYTKWEQNELNLCNAFWHQSKLFSPERWNSILHCSLNNLILQTLQISKSSDVVPQEHN